MKGTGIKDYLEYLEEFRATKKADKATLGGMIHFLAIQAEEAKDSNCISMFHDGVAESIKNAVKTKPSDPKKLTEDEQMISIIRTNSGESGCWIMELVNAAKKKNVTPENCEGFFTMLGAPSISGSVISGFINQINPYFPDEISKEDFRKALSTKTWTQYRLRRVSSAHILMKIRDDFVALGIFEDKGSVSDSIQKSYDAPWDITLSKKIPEKMLGYASLYLEACGTPIDNWWQGEKAVSQFPSVTAKKAKEIFKRYLIIKADVGDLEKITKTGELSKAVKAFW
jgi:hypothetical protein